MSISHGSGLRVVIWSVGDVWRVVRPYLANSGPFWTHGGCTCAPHLSTPVILQERNSIVSATMIRFRKNFDISGEAGRDDGGSLSIQNLRCAFGDRVQANVSGYAGRVCGGVRKRVSTRPRNEFGGLRRWVWVERRATVRMPHLCSDFLVIDMLQCSSMRCAGSVLEAGQG